MGTGPATRMTTLSTVEASTGTGCGSMLVGDCGCAVMAAVMSDAPWVHGWVIDEDWCR